MDVLWKNLNSSSFLCCTYKFRKETPYTFLESERPICSVLIPCVVSIWNKIVSIWFICWIEEGILCLFNVQSRNVPNEIRPFKCSFNSWNCSKERWTIQLSIFLKRSCFVCWLTGWIVHLILNQIPIYSVRETRKRFFVNHQMSMDWQKLYQCEQ